MYRLATAFLLTFIASAQEAPLRVAYTGRLLGHFRVPDTQSREDSECPANGTPSPRAVLMREHLTRHKDQFDVLVGTGDIFSPQLEARTFYQGPGELRIPKEQFSWSQRGGGWLPNTGYYVSLDDVPMDNVGCFLKWAKYDAVVPGKHDFYFGPERLRQLARFLAKSGPTAEYAPVRMLGANLVVNTTDPRARPRRAAFEKSRDVVWWAPEATGIPSKPITIDVPAFVTPWLRQITVRFGRVYETRLKRVNAADQTQPIQSVSPTQIVLEDNSVVTPRDRVANVAICPVLQSSSNYFDPDGIPRPDNWGKCVPLDAVAQVPGARLSEDITYTIKSFPDAPGGNYGLCAQLPSPDLDLAADLRDKAEPYLCRTFTVQRPFFTTAPPLRSSADPHAGKGSGEPGPIHPRMEDPPYHIKHVPGGTVAIFGVVDKNFREYVASLNAGWENDDENYDSFIGALDPVETLRQVLQACAFDPECSNAPKVLLAQMPSEQAAILVDQLPGRFDLVVSQTHPSRATVDNEITRSSSGPPGFVVTPRAMYDSKKPGSLDVRLQLAEIACVTSPCGTWRLTHAVHSSPHRDVVPASQQPPTESLGSEMLRYLLSVMKVPDLELMNWSLDQQAQYFALSALRRKGGKDAAILQKRDVFEARPTLDAPVDALTLQDRLDHVYWKNDYILALEVKGSTIKSILKSSKRFDAEDLAQTSIERGRGLVTLGIYEDPVTKDLLINGEVVQDDRLYTINAPDHVARGDTGYPELADVAIKPQRRLHDLGTLQSLSGRICHELRTLSRLRSAKCHDTVDIHSVLDHIHDAPYDTTPGKDPLFLFAQFLGLYRRPPGNLFQPASALERTIQQRPYWSVRLDRLEGGYNIYQHDNISETVVTERFGGVPVSQVTTPESSSLTSALTMRVARSWRPLEWFVLSENALNRTMVRDSETNEYAVSLPTNLWALESGLLVRFAPMARQPQNYGMLLSARWDNQIVRPLANFEVAGGVVLKGRTAKANLIAGKAGLRYQGQKNNFEAGYQMGRNRAAINGYNFLVNDAWETCDAPRQAGTLLGQTTIADCAKSKAASKFEAVTEGRRYDGWFLNFKFTVPLPMKGGIAYVMENRGNYYRWKKATSLDTRYFTQWTNSLEIPLVGNFSLVPKLDLFLYENAVNHDPFRAWQTSFTVKYSFDWRGGMPGAAFKFASPAVK